MSKETAIQHTEKWIKSVVIDLNFCPFAAKVFFQKSIRYTVVTEKTKTEHVLEQLLQEFEHLDNHDNIETSFLIFETEFENFSSYLKMIKKAERFLQQNDYDGVYQLASFHPNYCFAGSDDSDAANYTNRSPYPMIHILREESLSKALSLYPKPELIPEHNIALAQQKGLAYMQMLRLACFE